MAIRPIWGSEAAQLLAGRQLCTSCVAIESGEVRPDQAGPVNALAIDPRDVVHAGDAIAGTTACGQDANRWRWIVPTSNRPTIEEVPE